MQLWNKFTGATIDYSDLCTFCWFVPYNNRKIRKSLDFRYKCTAFWLSGHDSDIRNISISNSQHKQTLARVNCPPQPTSNNKLLIERNQGVSKLKLIIVAVNYKKMRCDYSHATLFAHTCSTCTTVQCTCNDSYTDVARRWHVLQNCEYLNICNVHSSNHIHNFVDHLNTVKFDKSVQNWKRTFLGSLINKSFLSENPTKIIVKIL